MKEGYVSTFGKFPIPFSLPSTTAKKENRPARKETTVSRRAPPWLQPSHMKTFCPMFELMLAAKNTYF